MDSTTTNRQVFDAGRLRPVPTAVRLLNERTTGGIRTRTQPAADVKARRVYAHGEPGSPVLVLETLLDHDHFSRWAGTEFVFLFNEQDPERYACLEKVVDSLPSRWSPWPGNVTVLPPENRAFSELGEGLLVQAKNGLIPLFAFVDPFGYRDAPIDLIRRLLQCDKAELFMLLRLQQREPARRKDRWR
jgi:three-Cys-motif partner protein